MNTRIATERPRWDGAEATAVRVMTIGDDEATPLVILPSEPVWMGGEATSSLGAAMPQAHRQITAQFAPFPGRRINAKPVATAAVAPDTWHLQGRTGALTGQAFGDYELGGILGEGGMGVIYRARQRSLGRRVAVKTLSSAVGQDPVQRGRFEIEARAAGLIRSPHVVQVHAAGSHNDTAYFVMEFVDGQHLGEVIREHEEQQRRIQVERVALWMLHAARGLAAAASHGVVHRDIKPSNLLLAQDQPQAGLGGRGPTDRAERGRSPRTNSTSGAVGFGAGEARGPGVDGTSRSETLKIADFGISRIQGESQLTRTGTAIGTPSYVSPEQGRGDLCDARSDLYSLGVVFYECLTGRKPFVGDTANAVIYQHSYSEPRLPRELDPTIPEHWQAVVMRCLQKDPARRYPDAGELVAEIERIQAGNVSLTAVFNARYGTGADEAMRRYLGRSRRWVAPVSAALLLVTVAVAGSGWWWFAQAGERATERRAAERLRGELRRTFDAIAPLPASASADIERLAAVTGDQDPDVRRWRARVTRIRELFDRLARLDQATLVDAALAGQAQVDLTALSALIGTDHPANARWQARLAANATEIARLRTALGTLDQEQLVSVAQQEATAADRARFASLAGTQDADLLRWNERIAASSVRLAALHEQLVVLDDPATALTEAKAKELASRLLDYHALLGTGRPMVEAVRWQERLATEQQRLVDLRTALARLDDAMLIAVGTQARLAIALTSYATLVPAEDPALRRWGAALVDHGRALVALRQSLALLDQPAALSGAQLDLLRKDLEVLRPLATADDTQVQTWTATLTALDASLRRERDALVPLDRDEPVPLAQQARAAIAVAILDHRGLLSDEVLLAYRRRLIAEQERVVALKAALAVADVPEIELTPALVDQVLLYGRLSGTDDVDYRRWYGRVVKAVQLREALAVLDGAHPLPDHARELLADYAAIFGEDDRRLHVWRAKVDRVTDLRRSLAVLDHALASPDDGAQRLAELLQLVGPFPGADGWQCKLDEIGGLHGQLAGELGPAAVHLDPAAREHLTALGVLEGIAGPRMQAWTKRLAWLAGPGRPAWAAAYAVDEHGPLAQLQLPGDPALTISFRYLPPSTSMIGSPLDEAGRDADEAQVLVTRTTGCWLAAHECTQEVYARISGTAPSAPGSAESTADRPVERITWGETQVFLAALNQQVPGFAGRLPREAEWEHAARAAGAGPWQGPRGALAESDLDQVAWFTAAAAGAGSSHPVGRRKPNALGLHDLHGNVWEWCEDRYGPYSPVPISDPLGVESDLRVARGGSWGDAPGVLRVANRLAVEPGLRSAYLGFRIACTADVPPEVRLEQSAMGDEPVP